MIGYEEYIKKHGKHFTVELAYAIAGNRWSIEEIEDSLQKKVYFNVAGFTRGDIVFLFNTLPKISNSSYHTKAQCTKAVIMYMEGIELLDFLFPAWTEVARICNYDFTPYI